MNHFSYEVMGKSQRISGGRNEKSGRSQVWHSKAGCSWLAGSVTGKEGANALPNKESITFLPRSKE